MGRPMRLEITCEGLLVQLAVQHLLFFGIAFVTLFMIWDNYHVYNRV